MTGPPDAAAIGAPTLLVGAVANDPEACRPLLEALSQRIIHFGQLVELGHEQANESKIIEVSRRQPVSDG